MTCEIAWKLHLQEITTYLRPGDLARHALFSRAERALSAGDVEPALITEVEIEKGKETRILRKFTGSLRDGIPVWVEYSYMRFCFDPLRTTQALSLLVILAQGRLEVSKAFALLYLADRRSLLENGSTLTGGRHVVSSSLPGLFETFEDLPPGYLRVDGKDLVSVADPGDGDLSDYDVTILSSLSEEYGRMTPEETLEQLSRLPEAALSDGPILYEALLTSAGVDQETIWRYADLNREFYRVPRGRYRGPCTDEKALKIYDEAFKRALPAEEDEGVRHEEADARAHLAAVRALIAAGVHGTYG